QAAAAEKTNKPNIIYILADDLGYGDVSCYNPESKIKTPHIDRLAAEGMKFTDAHTPSAVCTPTRYGILTGRYCWRTRLKYRVLDGFDPPLIEQDQVTVPSLLKKAGYDTACVGKWHLGMQWTDKNGQPVPAVPLDRKQRPRVGDDVDFTRPVTGGPLANGFDWYFGISASLNMSPFCFIENDRPVILPAIPSERIQTEFLSVDQGMRSPDFTIRSVMPTLTGEAVKYIEQHGKEAPERPFFLYFPLTAPHLPLVPNDEFKGKSAAGEYGDFVLEVDATVGAIMDALKRSGVAENTLVMFTSDNGGLYHWWIPQETDDLKYYKPNHRGQYVKDRGHQGNAHLRGTKADIWEGGHRVPFIIRWPSRIPADRRSDQLTCLTDIMATVAAILGRELPEDAAEDSFDLWPAWQDDAHPQIRPFILHQAFGGRRTLSIRKGNWKLMNHAGSGGNRYENHPGLKKYVLPEVAPSAPCQLYDLATDPGETTNLFLARPEVASKMKNLLDHTITAGKSKDLPLDNYDVLLRDATK
ncbi:MAG: arylsulfatase, partial [Planctomycetaceae bacterium]|nr:arylsulfatase [Planctomycetaceae bacterium]